MRLQDRVTSARARLRAAAHGNPYRDEPAPGPVPVGPLVSPLRFDVLVRAEHFAWHAEHRDLFARDFTAYAAAARERPYFVWFSRIMVPSWFAHLLGDADAFEAAWHERLRASAALHASFAERGFDPAHPILLHAAHEVRPTATGKRPSRTLFAGDGNHRLALLMAAGLDVLPASHFRVRRYRALVPGDTTGLLVRETGSGWPAYRSFLRMGYPDVQLDRSHRRVRVTAADAPAAAEVAALVAADLPGLEVEVA